MIISGERRYRAAREAGLRELPCIEMDVDDRAVAEIALIENLQRKDLTAFEEAEGLLVLVDRFGYTHEEVAKKIGKSRSSVTEALTIAALPAEIRELCRRADITAKSLLLQVVKQGSADAMQDFVRKVAERGLTRDEARRVGKKKQTRLQPYVFRYHSPSRDYGLEIKFRRSSVTQPELIQALEAILAELRQASDPSAPEA
jgi:ParB family chromosome partitioning protein